MVYLFIFAERTDEICLWKIHLHAAYFYTIVVPFRDVQNEVLTPPTTTPTQSICEEQPPTTTPI